MEFTIELEKWATPETDHHDSALLNSSGRMCCLGFIAKAGGATDEDILHCAYNPKYAAKERVTVQEVADLFWGSGAGTLINPAALINDSEEITQSERIWMLFKLFQSHGHHLHFTLKGIYLPASDIKALRSILESPKAKRKARDARYRAKLKAKRLEATVKAAEDAGLFPKDGDF